MSLPTSLVPCQRTCYNLASIPGVWSRATPWSSVPSASSFSTAAGTCKGDCPGRGRRRQLQWWPLQTRPSKPISGGSIVSKCLIRAGSAQLPCIFLPPALKPTVTFLEGSGSFLSLVDAAVHLVARAGAPAAQVPPAAPNSAGRQASPHGGLPGEPVPE